MIWKSANLIIQFTELFEMLLRSGLVIRKSYDICCAKVLLLDAIRMEVELGRSILAGLGHDQLWYAGRECDMWVWVNHGIAVCCGFQLGSSINGRVMEKDALPLRGILGNPYLWFVRQSGCSSHGDLLFDCVTDWFFDPLIHCLIT